MRIFQQIFCSHIKKHGFEKVVIKLVNDVLKEADEGYRDEVEYNTAMLFATLLAQKPTPRPEWLFVLHESIGPRLRTYHEALLFDSKRVSDMEDIVLFERISTNPDELTDAEVIDYLGAINAVPWSYNWGGPPIEDYLSALCAPYPEELEYELILDIFCVLVYSQIEEGPGCYRDPIHDFDDDIVPLPNPGESAEDAAYNSQLRRRVLKNYLSLYGSLKKARAALHDEGLG